MKTKVEKNTDGTWVVIVEAQELSDIIHLNEIFKSAPPPKVYHTSSSGAVDIRIYLTHTDDIDKLGNTLPDEDAEYIKEFLEYTRGYQ